MTIEGAAPGCPVVEAIRTPVTVPASAVRAFDRTPFSSTSLDTFEIAAVSLSLVTVRP